MKDKESQKIYKPKSNALPITIPYLTFFVETYFLSRTIVSTYFLPSTTAYPLVRPNEFLSRSTKYNLWTVTDCVYFVDNLPSFLSI